MPKISAKKVKKNEIVEIQVALEAGTKRVRMDPNFTGPHSVFRLPHLFLKEFAKRSLTDIRIFAEASRQYMIDRIYAGKAPKGRRIMQAPMFPHTTANTAAKAFELRPLRPRYRRWKKRKKLDGRILIAIGADAAYVMALPTKQHIGARFVKKGSKRITLRQLAATLEFGSSKKKIPPRPHWRPTAKEMARRFKKAPEKLAASALRAFMKKAKA